MIQYGARSPLGNAPCTVGSYCQHGIRKDCPAGSSCYSWDMKDLRSCRPGTYSEFTGQSKCQLCPPGTYCYYDGQATPYQCNPGSVCNYGGLSASPQPCPAGSYCSRAIASTISNSTMQEELHPLLCRQGTYCLQGVSTPEIDAKNARAAQKCIEGTFCGEGSDSPEGKGKCSPGYYCPQNVSEAIEAPAGHYAPGTGSSRAIPCEPGSYQDEKGNDTCKACTKGNYCPDLAMIWPMVCRAGFYARFEGQVACTPCPMGTFSNEIELTKEERCQPCEPKYLCPRAGLGEMYQATVCSAGFLCEGRSTETTMRNAPCPTGYFAAPGSASLEDTFLCPAGRFCPPGTGDSKQA